MSRIHGWIIVLHGEIQVNLDAVSGGTDGVLLPGRQRVHVDLVLNEELIFVRD
jgi:hypothetical protein